MINKTDFSQIDLALNQKNMKEILEEHQQSQLRPQKILHLTKI